MRICAFTHCSNGTYQLEKWKAATCEQHQVKHGMCPCPQPFQLYPFPTQRKNPQQRLQWINAVKREDPVTKKLWVPKVDDRICSKHFENNERNSLCPNPCINLGHKTDVKKRPPPRDRVLPEQKKPNNDTISDSPLHGIDWDHRYIYQCNCVDGCACHGCMEKEKKIQSLAHENVILRSRLVSALNEDKVQDICSKFLKTDEKVKAYTGLQSRAIFEDLFAMLEVKASKMQYWSGNSNTVTRTRTFRSSPRKMGPQRKLNLKEELLLVLMKLRLGVNSVLLADIMGISETTVSSVFNTWIKFLAKELKALILWPSKDEIQASIPPSLSRYPNLRCTIDCTEIFIERPRHREIQALTWSDYKKHNTIKFLIGIAPNGTITYLSKAWGGRASDRHITLNDGFLDLIEPYDLILADRGFNIREDLLSKMATLEIPPPSSGLEQMSTADVKKTKRIANARIHVERAIGRIKWFSILQNTLPITMLPLIDDILIVCAALCNLLPSLVIN